LKRLLLIVHLKIKNFIFKIKKNLNKPERKQMPGTATGTVLCNAVTVARALSSGVYFFLQSKPK
jgi:hypothetical protein